ncbi:hypothetical protein [Nodularia sp. UHCC 0506]|uniref:hypothetical protein n=1 Tax=Nodularia sp. UHCC 0506 TaxID=3110243 RepID=UPI002B204760|nr:hypothetical protein [Nodularia sp. UHCC 0506]MEA5516087.1 hypothetical protein [Nodularia sp. UHCC 0506]
MTVVRKSAVSTTGTWFQRNSTPSKGKRRSIGSPSTLADEALPVSSKKQQRPAKKLSVAATKRLPEPLKRPVSSLRTQSNTTMQNNQKSGKGSLPMMPTAGAAPFWLMRLYTSHRYSSVVTFLLVAITLCVYGGTVYSQKQWSQGYNRLQELQLHERYLTTTNAILKNKMAEEAEQVTSGLVSPTPAKTIFLPTAPPFYSSDSTPVNKQPNLATQQNTPLPLGY